MKKINVLVATVVFVIFAFASLVACSYANENDANLSVSANSEEVNGRITKGILAENLTLEEGEIAFCWGEDNFWTFSCFNDYMDSLSNTVNLDTDKLEYIVMPSQEKNIGIHVHCMEDKRNGAWSLYGVNYQKLDEKLGKVYPDYKSSWTSNVAKTYRFNMSYDKENPKYYYITFSASSSKKS